MNEQEERRWDVNKEILRQPAPSRVSGYGIKEEGVRVPRGGEAKAT